MVDFGLSNVYKKNELLNTACGSPCYAAPEMVAGQKYCGQKVDIWSVGVVFYAIITGYLPFDHPNTDVLYEQIMKGQYYVPQHLSPEAIELL